MLVHRLAASTAAFAVLSVLAPGLSYANGRFPIADQLVVGPKDPTHIVLRTTYGILDTSDAGGTWGWICDAAVGYGGNEDPAIGVLADGSVLAGVFEGLGVTHDRGCSWSFATGPLAGEYVIDVSVHRDEPSRAVALTSTGAGSAGFHVIIAETNDNGVTWTQAGTAISNDMIALTVDVAPSNPQRIYVSGSVGQMYLPAIERSDDRGVTWTRTYLDAAFASDVAFLAAVDPTNPDRVYVRASGANIDRLLVSDDGAVTFTEVFSVGSDLLGFALSPDGTRVAVGSPAGGIHLAKATDLAFTKISSVHTRCLTWTTSGLYACANEFVDGFTVGVSADEGKTFEGIYRLAEICPATCSVGAPTNGACATAWPPLAATLGVDQSKCGAIPSSSASSSGAVSSPPGSGCTCSMTTSSAGQTAGGVLAACALLAALRCRRRHAIDR